MSERLEAIVHGGDLDAARMRFPGAPEPWIDLSTGINPCPYPLPELAGDAWQRLPQKSDEWTLRQVAACRYRAEGPENVVCAPGTQALIQVLPRLVRPTHVAIVGPTYAEHAVAWQREGHDVVEIPYIEAAGVADVVVVVNPNNPTGRVTDTGRLRELAASLHARGSLLVVDEAFVDVMPDQVSLVPCLPPATVVLRSFGKMYGLAGARLGFAIAHEALAERLRQALGPWAVAGPALAIGAAALADERWLSAARERLIADSRRLDAVLAASGCDILGGTSLFRLAAHPRASQLADVLGCHGIHVRRFSYAPTWLRLGLPGSEMAWQRLGLALAGTGETQVGSSPGEQACRSDFR
ncbi:threonine-phosphate decarboxylase CobD [Hyphomicrobium sp.]|uniref:threonine-phosphate decarboxylase CobD n=1 Tax=Hyphomicrobium sp. TaxID=82 RepID=UPI0025C289B0|nr:threonine-phosphate decarboxylase CobD [Hyphomicrobium sp.]MCC7252918.1 threonine-phosphate decarboxylase [Hyphomicrobium sp.]